MKQAVPIRRLLAMTECQHAEMPSSLFPGLKRCRKCGKLLNWYVKKGVKG